MIGMSLRPERHADHVGGDGVRRVPGRALSSTPPDGWKITGLDEAEIAKLPETAWQAAVRQDGKMHEHAQAPS
ncbi:hypothetical protein [Nonomuraea sp. NPDC046570]|uniref:hypothetical protein n=1 Tax=Nonomuraea sp. NPDC046570 TaxID=3155255 RepID=UPI0033CFEEA6